MMLTQEKAIELAQEHPCVMNHITAYANWSWEEAAAFAQAAYEAGAKAENEACAITAWNHYADECKRSGLNAYHFGDWCAATAIRERRK